tara:strand:- start:58 stop:1191 length:1134 start_codon:yes stop_codon:yes gene_type:complete
MGKYDRPSLIEFCDNNAVVLDVIPDKCTRETCVSGACLTEGCDDCFEKTIRALFENGGPFCTTCTQINRVTKALTTQNIEFNGEVTIWNEELLQSLDIKNVHYVGTLNRDTPIGGDCQIENCCNQFRKPFREVLNKGGPFCTTCTQINRVTKALTTQNIEIKTEPVIYDYKLLERIIKTRKLHVNLSRYKGKYLSRESLIKGMCIIPNCPDMFEKNFRSLYENDVPCCETCTKRIRMSRSKKARFEKEEFKTPGGQTWYLQGYESLVAPELIKEYGEENIIAAVVGDRRVPAIPWFDEDGGKHHYFCDFFIPNLNLIIEVKSTWTEEQNDDKIKRTRKVSNELGYDFRLIVLNKAGEWVEDVTSSSQHQPCSMSSPS